MRDASTGLLGATLDVDTAAWVRPAASIGAGSDSFHEYLLKVRRGALSPPACIRGLGRARMHTISIYHARPPAMVQRSPTPSACELVLRALRMLE